MVSPYECDVLLYHGNAPISRAIRLLDGTDVNHAGLYLSPGHVAEALFNPGLTSRPLEQSTAGSEWVRSKRLKTAPFDMSPVRTRADAYLADGDRYAYEQILLLAFLCLSRRARLTPVLRLLVRTALDTAASWVASLMEAGKEPLICSEFVFRAYDEAVAGSGDQYSLRIPGATDTRQREPDMRAAPRGSGIQRGSLLDWYASSSTRSWDQTYEAVKERTPVDPTMAKRIVDATAAEGTAATTPELDATIERYLEEIEAPPDSTDAIRMRDRQPEVSDHELRESVESFAVTYAAATDPVVEARSLGELRSVSNANATLTRVAADFVTPGDLLKTNDLYDVGNLK